MIDTTSPAARLCVAFDNKKESKPRRVIRTEVIACARKLRGTGVCIKLNHILRVFGYDLIDELHDMGFAVFADYKLYDIEQTLENEGAFLCESRPEIVTVSCVSGKDGFIALKRTLPDTLIAAVAVLTTLNNNDSRRLHDACLESAMLRLVRMINTPEAADALIAAPGDLGILKHERKHLKMLTPCIREKGVMIIGDDQNADRSMPADEAIKAGADMIVVGRPITQAADPYAATMRHIEQIASAM